MTEASIPICPGPDPAPRPPNLNVPPRACDTHAHLFGPATRYPYSPSRGYTPPDATLESFLHLHQTLGIDRAVLTQPSVYGTDNRAILDAVAQTGDRMRAVVAVEEGVSDQEIERLHAAGARGIRINLVDKGGMPFESLASVEHMGHRIKAFGWHIEVLIHVSEFPDLRPTLSAMPVDVVVGHLGYMPTAQGLDNPGFQDFLALLRDGRCWVKLTGPYRITGLETTPYTDVAPFAHVLIDAAPNRILWGTDWPHPTLFNKPMPNDGDLLDHLAEWAPDEQVRNRILVDNPAALYGFD